MLRDIAERMTELVMDRFAVSDARFELDDTRDAVTLYQRFAFLRALFEGENFQGALREIIRRPHTAWETTSEMVRPGAGMRADSHVLRQLARGGPRSLGREDQSDLSRLASNASGPRLRTTPHPTASLSSP